MCFQGPGVICSMLIVYTLLSVRDYYYGIFTAFYRLRFTVLQVLIPTYSFRYCRRRLHYFIHHAIRLHYNWFTFYICCTVYLFQRPLVWLVCFTYRRLNNGRCPKPGSSLKLADSLHWKGSGHLHFKLLPCYTFLCRLLFHPRRLPKIHSALHDLLITCFGSLWFHYNYVI